MGLRNNGEQRVRGEGGDHMAHERPRAGTATLVVYLGYGRPVLRWQPLLRFLVGRVPAPCAPGAQDALRPRAL